MSADSTSTARVAVAVIPARYASTRFPGKPLALVAGLPMVVRVLRNMRAATSVSRVLVATDDDRIADAVRAEGGEAVMTSADAPSGSDRVWRAVADIPCDFVVNVQGDEPLIPPAVIDAVVARLHHGTADIATPVVAAARATADDPDVVTVARDRSGGAHYFSRSVIPWGADPVWRHIGVYGFRRAALARFVAAPPDVLELTEGLEQLRALAIGLRIDAVEVDCHVQGVDRPGDVARVEAILARLPPAGPSAED